MTCRSDLRAAAERAAAALAELADDMQCASEGGGVDFHALAKYAQGEAAALRAALAAEQPQPVGYVNARDMAMVRHGSAPVSVTVFPRCPDALRDEATPLYAAPPPPAAAPVPASRAALQMSEERIDEYVAEYALNGDSSVYILSERERALLKDAIMGLTAECADPPAAAPTVTDAMVEAACHAHYGDDVWNNRELFPQTLADMRAKMRTAINAALAARERR